MFSFSHWQVIVHNIITYKIARVSYLVFHITESSVADGCLPALGQYRRTSRRVKSGWSHEGIFSDHRLDEVTVIAAVRQNWNWTPLQNIGIPTW